MRSHSVEKQSNQRIITGYGMACFEALFQHMLGETWDLKL
jgi:hypothetical protein